METSNASAEGNLMYEVLPTLVLAASAGRSWSDRFVELLALEAGWLTGETPGSEDSGEPVPPETLILAHRILDLCETHNWCVPRIYPIEEGGVNLEWGAGKWVAEIEITIQEAPDNESSVHLNMFDLQPDQNKLGTFYDQADIPTLVKFLSVIGTRPL